MFKWHIVYTTDCDKSRQTLNVQAETYTKALFKCAEILPRDCFLGTSEHAAIIAVVKCDEKVTKTDKNS